MSMVMYDGEKVLYNLVYISIFLLPFIMLAGCAFLLWAVEGNLINEAAGVLLASVLLVCACAIAQPRLYVTGWMEQLGL